MSFEWPLLVKVINNQVSFAELSLSEWGLLVRQARASMLLAKLVHWVEGRGGLDKIPEAAQRHLISAKCFSEKQSSDLFWEIRQLQKVARQLGFPLILLKGAAYVVAEHPAARGRVFSDIDLLVPRENIGSAEKRLMIHGWLGGQNGAYNERYYRRWMHEIPPIRHLSRGSVIDLHHNILPITCKDCPDAGLLLADARALEKFDGLAVLSPVDQVIHSAVHLFYDGELEHGLRDLVDLDALIRGLGEEQARLISRSSELGLTRPVLYALRYSTTILGTPLADEVHRQIQELMPAKARMAVMDFLFIRALMPVHPSCTDRWTGLARNVLFLRAHWLKMPWYLLLPHLTVKAWMRLTGKEKH